jgi:dinuclear metal center YbgI/SA1388 family protein
MKKSWFVSLKAILKGKTKMKVIELYNKLGEIIPPSLSCAWDKDGLESCPEPEKDIGKVLITLDITNAAIDRAVEGGFDVIVSHHPIFFGGLGVMNALTFDGAKAVRLAKNNIAAMSFHTRLDAVEGGVNDILAALVGLKNVRAIGDDKIARVGELEEEIGLTDFVKNVKASLSHGEDEREASLTVCNVNGKTKKVALVGGSGGDMMNLAKEAGADTYLTGDAKHHEYLGAADFGINLVCAGHFFTEYPVCAFLEEKVREICPEIMTEIFFSNTTVEF